MPAKNFAETTQLRAFSSVAPLFGDICLILSSPLQDAPSPAPATASAPRRSTRRRPAAAAASDAPVRSARRTAEPVAASPARLAHPVGPPPEDSSGSERSRPGRVARPRTRGGSPYELQGRDWSSDSDSSGLSAEGAVPALPPTRTPGTMPITPRTGHVDRALRKKVRRGEFFPLKKLLPTPRGVKVPKKFSLGESGVLEQVEEHEELSFSKWLDAFVIYTSIRLEFHPEEAQGLLRHLQIVRGMQEAGKDGLEYDYQFRRVRAQHSDVQWGEYLAELAYDIKPAKRFFPSSRLQRNKPTRPLAGAISRPAAVPRNAPGLCHHFNSPRGCLFPKCVFSHRCSRCNVSGHSERQCKN